MAREQNLDSDCETNSLQQEMDRDDSTYLYTQISFAVFLSLYVVRRASLG